MLIIIPILILFAAAGGTAAIRLARPGFAYSWLIATIGGLIAWLMILITGLRLPVSAQLPVWKPVDLFPASPFLLEDRVSWPFALALATLALAVILTAVARLQTSAWRTWSYNLVMIALGIISVLAGNPITLLIAWASVDILEVIVFLTQIQDSASRRKVVFSFIPRVAGILMLYWAIFIASTQAEALNFNQPSPSISVYLLLAAGLRLGVLPLHVPFLLELPLHRGLGTVLRLVPAASSFMLLARVAGSGIAGPFAPALLILTLLVAVYGAWGWVSADNEINGRSFWVLATAGLALAAAINGFPGAVIAWGTTCLLSGGVLFLASTRPGNLRWIVSAGVLGLVAIPFTPGWYEYEMILPPQAAAAGAGVHVISILLLLVAEALLLRGFLRYAWLEGSPVQGAERWVWLIYPLGLLIMPLSQVVLGLMIHPGLDALSVWAGAAVLLPVILAAGLFYLRRGQAGLPIAFITSLRAALSLNWLYHLVSLIYQAGRKLIFWMDFILEGQGGLLWALLILALLFTLLAGQGMGG